jgi:hypothetical protein
MGHTQIVNLLLTKNCISSKEGYIAIVKLLIEYDSDIIVLSEEKYADIIRK